MFKKIEKNFTILSMTILSITVLICFISIYGFMNNNINKEIERDLIKNFSMPFEKRVVEGFKREDSLDMDRGERPPLGFIVIYNLDSQSIVEMNGLLNIDNIDDFQSTDHIILKALESKKDSGKIKLDNSSWAFLREDIDGSNIAISFVERSSQDRILNTLVKVFIFVYLLLLILIYFISKYFGKKSIEPAKLAYEKQTEFIGDISHELKTPIAIIQTNAEVLKMNEDEKISDEIEWLDNIIAEVKRMNGLIRNLLDLTIDLDSNKGNYEDINLKEVITSVIKSMQSMAGEKNQFISGDLEDINYKGNELELERLVYLIVDNAIKYGYENTIINVELKRKNNNIIMTIENTGDDIDDNELGKIFDRFYRGEKSRNRDLGGYGLGLSMAEKIVKEHKGDIRVESRNNRSKFTIIL